MSDVLVLIPVLVIAAALLILFLMRRKREALHMPEGMTIYHDTQEQGTTLYSHRYRLKGRPDFLLKQGNLIIPVEAKTGKTPNQPYYGHVMQLIAYCVLVEEVYGVRPPHGVIRYPDGQFVVAFTLVRESELIHILADMQEKKKLVDVHRNHTSGAKCSSCGFALRCSEQLDMQISFPLDFER